MDRPLLTRRIPRSCTECARRKIKCDHEYPCGACTRRRQPGLCMPPDFSPHPELHSDPIDREKLALQHRIATLEARLGESSSTRLSNHAETNPEGLLVMLENLSLGQSDTSTTIADGTIAPLYQSGKPVFLMLIPDRESSQHILNFALANLTWMHCAVRAQVFQREHILFWESMEAGDECAFGNDHAWLSVYFSLLAAGLLFMDPAERPMLPRLSALKSNTDNDRGMNIARMWYEAAVKELEASNPLAKASLRVVQTVAILTLVHNHFGQSEQEYLLLGMAINTARTLDMHLLASEDRYSQRLASHAIWSNPENRRLGRRLWWTIVTCDWLGIFSHPSSISPSSFNTILSAQDSDSKDLFLETASLEATDMPPLQYHLTMSQLASVIYTHIKAPREPNSRRFSQVFDKLEAIREAMSRRKVSSPLNAPEWVAVQHYLIGHTVQLISVTIARASLVLWLLDKQDTEPIIDRGLKSALNILSMRQQPVPRLYQCHWAVSTATLAAGVYLAIHLICFKEDTVSPWVTDRRTSIRYCIDAIKYPNPQTPLATRGAQMLERLLQIELHSPPSIGPVDKEMLINLLKMAFQSEGSSFDPLTSYGTIMPSSLDLSSNEIDPNWPVINDLDLDELLPDLDWGQLYEQMYW